MSCYNWEQGTIEIPRKEWASFRTGMLKFRNQQQQDLLDACLRAHIRIEAAGKGKRGKARKEAQEDALHVFCGDRKHDWGWDHSEKFAQLCGILFPFQSASPKLTRPKKKDMGIVATSKSASFAIADNEAHVSFNNENRSVSWVVHENNRAVERAHEDKFAQTLFRTLSRIAWTRNTGGKIIGNDEYNRSESDWEGGGGNYVTFKYGPLGDGKW